MLYVLHIQLVSLWSVYTPYNMVVNLASLQHKLYLLFIDPAHITENTHQCLELTIINNVYLTLWRQIFLLNFSTPCI
jgi:hypothetical protein